MQKTYKADGAGGNFASSMQESFGNMMVAAVSHKIFRWSRSKFRAAD